MSNTTLCCPWRGRDWTTNICLTLFLEMDKKTDYFISFISSPSYTSIIVTLLQIWSIRKMSTELDVPWCQITIKVSRCFPCPYFYQRPGTNGSQTSPCPSTLLHVALNWRSLNSSSVAAKDKFWKPAHESSFSTKTQSQQRLKSNINKAPKIASATGSGLPSFTAFAEHLLCKVHNSVECHISKYSVVFNN